MSLTGSDAVNSAQREAFLDETPKGILQGVENYLDGALDVFIFRVYEALINDYSYTILTIGTLYVAFYCIAIYRGLIQASTEELLNAVIRLVIVFGLLFKFDDFLRLAHSALTVWPDEIITTIISTVNLSHQTNTVSGIKNTMDLYFDQGMKLSMILFEKGSITSPVPWIFGVLSMLVMFLLGAIPLGMALVAKVGIGILLGITPIFLIFMLFKKTSGFFEAWVRNLMTLVFLKILAFSVMVVSLFVVQYPIMDLKHNAIENTLTISQFIGIFVIGFVFWQFYKHIGGVASSLGSGFVLQTSGLVEKHGPTAYNKVKSGITGLVNRFKTS